MATGSDDHYEISNRCSSPDGLGESAAEYENTNIVAFVDREEGKGCWCWGRSRDASEARKRLIEV